MTKEQEKIQIRIREYKKSLDMVEPVKAIIKAFDGKCYNCRFGKAIAEIGAYEDKSSYSDWITIRRRGGESSYDAATTIGSIKLSELLDGKRVNAKKVIAAVDEHAETVKKLVFRLEHELKYAEGTISYINQRIAEINEIIDNLSSESADIYRNRLDRTSHRLQ